MKIDVVTHFEEDYSAKDFNRPEFDKLLDFVKINRGEIDLLLFTKWDRFSRNLEESLRIMRVLRSYGVTVNAAEQPLDLTLPDNKVMLALYLSIPEVENDKNSLRTIEGSRRAIKEGCWTGQAPFGYMNIRNELGQSTLRPIEKAKLVKKAFQLFSSGIYSKEEVRRMIRVEGFTLSKQQFNKMLKSVVCVGKIFIKAYGDEEDEIVDGLHESIISLELFQKVQNLISRKTNQPVRKSRNNDLLPLRGHLVCSICGNNLTGSGSKSRTGKKHY